MPTSTLQEAQRFAITGSRTGRTYDISVMRPLANAPGPRPTDCPIFFVLDSALAFGTCVERGSMYAALGSLQQSVIVGIGYPEGVMAALRLRTFDFTPETPAGAHADLHPLMGNDFGGADAFLEFILGELTEAVKKVAPEASSTRKVLHGFSLGGLFSAYALLKRPDAFETVSSIAPSLWWNEFEIFRELPAFTARLNDSSHKPRVLIGVGALEQEPPKLAPPGVKLDDLVQRVKSARMVDAARDFAQSLRAMGVPEVQLAVFDGEDHAGALTAGSGRAVNFALGVR